MFSTVINLISSIRRRRKLRNKWRELNSHNSTKLEIVPDSEVFFSRVRVGKGTYGPIKAIYSYAENEYLEIGNYCSIGSGTTFMLGSEHSYKGISTFPFKVKMLDYATEAESKGPIVVEDDVWMGENVLVLSGVKIGKGAVVAAGSIVVKNVPPYAIVGGSPAKVLKYRFSEEIINKLMKIDWSKLDQETISKNADLLYENINEENVDRIIDKLKL